MLKDIAEGEFSNLPTPKTTALTPSAESILAELSINSATVKTMKRGIKRTQYRAVINWLTKYKPLPDVANIEQVKGFIEAFYHLCEVLDWNNALKIITVNINFLKDEQLHNQLFTWGYYKELLNLYENFLDLPSCNPYYKPIFLYSRGNIYSAQGYFAKAIDSYQQALDFADTELNLSEKATILNGIALAYLFSGENNQAINYSWQSLRIAEENKNYERKAIALNTLGLISCQEKKFKKAIKYCKESLRIAQENRNFFIEGRALGSLAQAYSGLEQYENIIEYQNQSLNIMRELQYTKGEAEALCNLGVTFAKMKEYSKAEENLQAALAICRKIEDYSTEVYILENLAMLDCQLNNYQSAKQYSSQALNLHTKLDIPLTQAFQQLVKYFQYKNY